MRTESQEVKDLFTRDQVDMRLPKKLIWANTAILLPGTVFLVLAIINGLPIYYLICPLLLFIAGLALPLCIRNQMLVMLPEDRFAYRTMFGNIYVYHFDEVKTIAFYPDSKKLIMKHGKSIHMERCAWKSERFSLRLNQLEEALRAEAIERLKNWDKS